MSEITRILSAIERGDSSATCQLLPMVYDELRRLATQKIAQEKPGQTLQATALVHEAYVRLVAGEDDGGQKRWDNSRHFFAAAAEAMRRILLDRARNKQRQKRGGGWRRLSLEQIELLVDEPPEGVVALDEALQKLEKEDSLCAELVKLRFFAGLTLQQAAAALDIPRRSADRTWAFARSWLYHELDRKDEA